MDPRCPPLFYIYSALQASTIRPCEKNSVHNFADFKSAQKYMRLMRQGHEPFFSNLHRSKMCRWFHLYSFQFDFSLCSRTDPFRHRSTSFGVGLTRMTCPFVTDSERLEKLRRRRIQTSNNIITFQRTSILVLIWSACDRLPWFRLWANRNPETDIPVILWPTKKKPIL